MDAGTAAAAVASRKFGAARGSRCYCSWHRRCSCHDDSGDDNNAGRLIAKTRSGSNVLSQSEYGRAGFRGDTPPGLTYAEIADGHKNVLPGSLELLGAYAVIVLTIGLIKAIWPRYRSHWLWMVTSNWLSEMRAYREPELRPCRLIRDGDGYYIHPVTRSRNIRLMNVGQQFVINVLFFIILPIAFCLYRRRKSGTYRCLPSSSLLISDCTVATKASGRLKRHKSASVGHQFPAPATAVPSGRRGSKPQHSLP